MQKRAYGEIDLSKVTHELDVRAQIILTLVFLPFYCPAFLCWETPEN